MLDVEFKREQDVRKLASRVANNKIKIIAGLRRAGKSYLLDPLFKKYLMENRGCIEENFEIKDFSKQDEITSAEQFKTYLSGLIGKDSLKYIFLDEPQETGDQFAEVILKFHKMHPEYEIYITGSNSKTLSDDIVNFFGDDGDSVFIESLPYVEIKTVFPKFSLDDYFKVGGLPVILIEETETDRLDALKNLNHNLYVTDIQNRLAKANVLTKILPLEAESFLRGICLNLTSPASVSSIVSSCVAKGRANGNKERNEFSKDCLSIFQEAENSYFLYKYIYPCNKPSDRNPNAWESYQIKYYCYDIGLLRAMANSQDIKGAALENAVFLELHRRKIDARPYIEYDSKGNETKNIDFAFEFEGRNILLQVTHEINANDEEREVTNLLNISGNYEKYIVYVNNLLGQEAGITYLTADKFFINFL